jgi:FAD:protein FMN transferase
MIKYLLILALFISGCTREETPFTRQFIAMGTYFQISIYDKNCDKKIFTKCVNRVHDIETWGNLFDINSEISQVNKNAIIHPVKINPEFFDILQTAILAGDKTKGAFDITIKPLIDLYQIKTEKTPKLKMLPIVPEEIKNKIGYKNIILNKENQTVFLKNQAQIDLSGILKGYAVDVIAEVLRKNGVKKAMINGGGNLYCLGTDENDRKWKIGIKDPNKLDRIVKKNLELKNQAVSTSGGYERYIFVGTENFSHIVNPITYKPVKAKGAVTVVADSAIWADIWSTAIFVDNSLSAAQPKGSCLIIN